MNRRGLARTGRASFFAGLLLLLSASTAAADTRARLLVKGGARPGADIRIQVELSWDGRPEQLLPRVPEVTIPDGGALRLGTTGSRFDGERSTWWTNGVVTLPDRGGPYVIGPATIETEAPGGQTAQFRAEPRTLGRGRRRSLLGQGLASGAVLAAALSLLVVGWRRLVAEERVEDPIATRRAALESALSAGECESAVAEALALHDLLAAHPIARDYVGAREGLQAYKDELAYGGARASAADVRQRVGPLLAIAGALE